MYFHTTRRIKLTKTLLTIPFYRTGTASRPRRDQSRPKSEKTTNAPCSSTRPRVLSPARASSVLQSPRLPVGTPGSASPRQLRALPRGVARRSFFRVRLRATRWSSSRGRALSKTKSRRGARSTATTPRASSRCFRGRVGFAGEPHRTRGRAYGTGKASNGRYLFDKNF